MAVADQKKLSAWDRAMARFGTYFEERGLTVKDIPAAIVIHEVIGLAIAITAWTVRRISEERACDISAHSF